MTYSKKIRTILTIVFLFLVVLSYAQTNDSTKIIKSTYESYEDLREKQEKAEIDVLTYIDLTFNYQVQVPNWLNLKETGSIYFWGGTLPPIEGIENAIVIKAFDKSSHKSFKQFKKYIVKDLKLGQTPPWSNTHRFLLKKELGKYRNIGDRYKVNFMRGNLIYHSEYVLVETKTAYLWIDFTATPETFDKNIDKFNEFMDGFVITNFNK